MSIFKLIGKLILYLIKKIVSISIGIVLFFFIAMFIIEYYLNDIESKVLPSSKKEKIVSLGDKTYIFFDMSQYFQEDVIRPHFFEERSLNFYQLLTYMDKIADDPKIKGVLFEMDDLAFHGAQLEEFSKKILKLGKNGKETISYMTTVDKSNLMLSSFTNQIYMPPSHSTNVDITAYNSEKFYIKDFAQKWGVSINVINVGDYKSYGEHLEKSEMSPEVRQNITRIYEKNYLRFLKTISENRKIDKDRLNSEILSGNLVAASSSELFKLKLIDKLDYLDNILDEKDIVSFESYVDYKKDMSKSSKKESIIKDKIAIIYLEGVINKHSGYGIEESNIYENDALQKLNTALNDENIKGVVLRIDSPGGDSLYSDIISERVRTLNETIPVYVSIGNEGASGGYYIATSGEKIFSSESTITGSIGVVSVIPEFSKLLDENQIKVEEVKKGNYSDIYSAYNSKNKDEIDKLYASSFRIYEDFLNVVAEGRNIKKEKVHEIAQGKVWLGSEALENGLIDKIGGIEDTILELVKDLNLEKYEVVEIKGDESFRFNSILTRYFPLLKTHIINQIKSNTKIKHQTKLYK